MCWALSAGTAEIAILLYSCVSCGHLHPVSWRFIWFGKVYNSCVCQYHAQPCVELVGSCICTPPGPALLRVLSSMMCIMQTQAANTALSQSKQFPSDLVTHPKPCHPSTRRDHHQEQDILPHCISKLPTAASSSPNSTWSRTCCAPRPHTPAKKSLVKTPLPAGH